MAENKDGCNINSSDDDVFECGRCKQRFTSMEIFMVHKKSKVCYKTKIPTITESNDNSKVGSFITQHQTNEHVLPLVSSTDIQNFFSSTPSNIPVTGTDSSVSKGATEPTDVENLETEAFQPGYEANRVFTQIVDPVLDTERCTVKSASNPSNNNKDMGNTSRQGNETTDIILAASIASGIETDDLFQEHGGVVQSTVECAFCDQKINCIDNLPSHYVKVHNIATSRAILLTTEKRREINKTKMATRRALLAARATQKTSSHFCRLCNMSFQTGTKLNKHRKTQKHLNKKDREEAYKGEEDPELEEDVDESEDMEESTYKCATCNFEALDMNELREHLSSHKRVKDNFQCDQCEVSFPSKSLLADHMSAVHGKEMRRPYRNRKVTCDECGQQVLKRGIVKHKRLHAKSIAAFFCELCKHNALKENDYEAHIEFHKSWVPVTFQDEFPSVACSDNIEALPSGIPNQNMIPVGTLLPNASTSNVVSQLEMNPQSGSSLPSSVDFSSMGFEHLRTMQAAESLAQMCPEAAGGKQPNILNSLLGKAVLSSEPTLQPAEGVVQGDMPSVEMVDPVQESNDKLSKAGKLKCKECDNYHERSELPKHMWEKHQMVKQFQCRDMTCKRVFLDFKEFCQHVSTSHADSFMFRCSCKTCLKKESVDPNYKAALKKEKMRMYYQQMSFKCMKCWVKFPSQAGLDKHLARESHNYPCPECGKIHVSKRQLRIHMITHQTERQYLCEKCGQDFKTPRDLQRHSVTHSNVKPFQCNLCGKGFSFRNKLHRHKMTVHSGVKPFTCSDPGCNKAFARKDKLTDHQRTHLTYEPFKCEFCQKGFFRKDNLKDHLVLHTGEFRFRCDICNKGFMRPKLLERHKKTEHTSTESLPVDPQTFMDSTYQLCTIDGQTLNEACQQLGMKSVGNHPLQIQVKITQMEK
ncbi:uncharacterized protein LOC144352626 [Saccoglossus kowalevskii]